MDIQTIRSKNLSYGELIKLESFTERLNYLMLYDNNASNQNREATNRFYKSNAWLTARNEAIKRDFGYDLGVEGFPIPKGELIVHHIIPITESDIENGAQSLFDLNNLICVSKSTHNTIHYSTNSTYTYVERTPGDTKLW